ncbi:glyoxylase-like metal-dependent hydrolase (beta-lactamase superfamily II) [Onishia taeanensis]|uniref:Glyoxylase-like metal-dependent hydrolase (Beta-lactamase superfamily II) n=1 Tax=Onishia taeanensis TaxID=284577 RepID=A0A328XLD3_9GAMM|nr:MBL fold metallo-hydrolase [Halomonas taeanensis]RAR58190.1 glyoxylase-like metal-dependent hydrolase (beta-lactamase superfamily II) [Halomonas taeanensis]
MSSATSRLERIAPDQWYRIQRLSDGITLIDEPWIKPFFRCNLWHVRGRDRDLLVDFGLGAVPLRRHVALLAERDLVGVASHTHFDHIGAASEFDYCHVHAAEADILAAPDNARTLADAFLNDEMFDALPPAPYAHSGYRIPVPPKIAHLEDGDVIDLGDRRFEVIHTPGHSPGGIALWEAASATLISGDLVYDGPLIEDAWHSNLDDYAASMRRLRALPARVVHGGHFPSFSGERLNTMIDDWLAHHDL